jgi:hypothetical protein
MSWQEPYSANVRKRSQDRLSIDSCQRLLGPIGRQMADGELERLRDELYALARVTLTAYAQSSPDARRAQAVTADDRFSLDERAAILQFDGKLSRDTSDRLAVVMHSSNTQSGH